MSTPLRISAPAAILFVASFVPSPCARVAGAQSDAEPARDGEIAADELAADDADADVVADGEIVVTTAGRRAQRASEASVSTSVVTREEAEARGATSVAEVLETEPGVEIVPSLAGTEVRLRGLDPRQTLILVDGERVIGRTDGALDLARIPVEQVERIEIVRGASSSIHGSDAIGGVVNIITRGAPEGWTGEARLRALGVTGATADASALGPVGFDVAGTVAHGSDDLGARLSVGVHRRPAFDFDRSTPSTDGSRVDDHTLGGRLRFTLSEAVALTVRVRTLLRVLHGVDDGPGGAVLDRRNHISDSQASLGLDARLSDAVRVDIRLAGMYFRDRFVRDQRGSDQEDLDQLSDHAQQTLQARVVYEHPGGEHVGTFGLDQRYEWQSTPRLVDDGSRARFAPLVDLPMSLTAGVRGDFDTQFGVAASPRVALRLAPGDWVIRANAGLGFRAPDFKELYLAFENPSAGYRVDGTPDLDPERARSLGLDFQWRAHARISLGASFFRTRLDDLIDTAEVEDPGEVGQVFRYVNVEEAITQGWTGTIELAPIDGLRLGASHTFLDARNLTSDARLLGRARHRVTFSARYEHERAGTSLGVRGVYLGPRPEAAGRADADVQLRVRVAQDIGEHIALQAGADNLLGSSDNARALRPRTIFAGASVTY